MIDGTFAVVAGVGPARERELHKRGIRAWSDLPVDGPVLSPLIDAQLREGVARARSLLDARNWTDLAALLPVREHWRFWPHVAHGATCLDIESTADGRITVIGLFDEVRGPRLFVRGLNLGAFVEERLDVVVTFNGAAFDLPVLHRSFPRWRFDGFHLDLRTVMRRLRESGGLKSVEDRLGIGRPEHLRGLDGAAAIQLWREFARSRDENALRHLLEYNLYDAVQLRALGEIACERISEKTGRGWSPAHPFRRGDVLLDVTRAVDAVVARAPSIVPDAMDDEERVALRL